MERTVINVAAPYLAEEMITNILKRLPVKSLLRFRCVCKQWKNLFKTPSFIQEHLSHSNNQDPSLLMVADCSNDGLFLFLFSCTMQFREVDNAPLIGSFRGFELVGSSNGLLCFINKNKHPPAPLVWNPATRELKQVPCDEFSGLYLDNPFYLDFGWCFGFGFNPVINEYKIVRLSQSYSDISEAKVCSLGTGSWRNIQFDKRYVSISSHSVTVKGVTFWHGSDNFIMGTQDCRHVIISFDLATEMFNVIPWPALVSFSGPDFADYSADLAVYDACNHF
ncbi:hypothetical protein QN277_024654 [Acacia crassicarpa]|uniref:F-box domain-containing protein n=1 Tax=Acacia crassicarpa TaxID=499986 RepID=A0AAE1JCP9_9FABA|nr:hypothetical protein QN277_024654 [Acacia crassicarpa]